MPHFTVHIPEEVLDGQVEPAIIRTLTDAVTKVYGEQFRSLVVVELFGVPQRRWGVGGMPTKENVPIVALAMREAGLAPRPTVEDPPAALIASITDAVVEVFGEGVRKQLNVVITGIPAGRSGVAGVAV